MTNIIQAATERLWQTNEVDDGKNALLQPRTICSKEHNYFKMQIFPVTPRPIPRQLMFARIFLIQVRSQRPDRDAPSLSPALLLLLLGFRARSSCSHFLSETHHGWRLPPVTSQFKSADRVCVSLLGDHPCGVPHRTPPVSCQLCVVLFASAATTDDAFHKNA